MRSTHNITVLNILKTGEQTPLPKNPLSYFWCHVTRMGHHPHQQKDSWNCVVRLLHCLSQQQLNQGQNKLTNNVMAVITYLDDIIVIVNSNLILSESRGAIERSLDGEMVTARKSH